MDLKTKRLSSGLSPDLLRKTTPDAWRNGEINLPAAGRLAATKIGRLPSGPRGGVVYRRERIAGGLGEGLECRRRNGLVLTIRLSRIGKKKRPFYRVVVIERTRPRDGRVRELVGTYDPLKKPAEIKLDAERIKYWLGVGAQPSDTVRSFLRLQKIA